MINWKLSTTLLYELFMYFFIFQTNVMHMWIRKNTYPLYLRQFLINFSMEMFL